MDYRNEVYYHLILSKSGNYWGFKISYIFIKKRFFWFFNNKPLLWTKSLILKQFDCNGLDDSIIQNIKLILIQKKNHISNRPPQLINPNPDHLILWLLKSIISPTIHFILSIILISSILYSPLYLLKKISIEQGTPITAQESFTITEDLIKNNYTPPPLFPSAPTGLRVLTGLKKYTKTKDLKVFQIDIGT